MPNFSEERYLLFTRNRWEQNPFHPFTKYKLDKAEKHPEGFIGYWNGVKCLLWKYEEVKNV